MATINGITVKSFKSFSGIEYPSIREANVWKDGKKIGTYREDEWGGPSHFTNGLNAIIKPSAIQYQSGCKESWKKALECDSDVFMGHLLELVGHEKTFKKFQKQGCPATLFAQDNSTTYAWGLRKPLDMSKPLPKQIEEVIKKHFKGKYCVWQFADENDFNITVDEKHPVPNYLDMPWMD